MTLKPLQGFRSLETHHCVTGSMRHVYVFHKHPISEEMLLGLGAGVGFVYWHMQGQPPFLGGRANVGRPGEEGLEITAGRRTGVQVNATRTASAKKAEAGLLALLEAREPVMLQVDMGYLPYFDFPVEYHFGGHVVVAAGYDAETGTVLIADRDAPLHPVSLADLALARGSRFKPFPPQHAWYTFDFSGRRAPEPAEVWSAIRTVTAGLLEPPIANLGVKGIRKAAGLLPRWPESMKGKELRGACFNGYIMIDATGGTGGGLFRYMYARFLLEAQRLTGERRLRDVAHELIDAGGRWQVVAETLHAASRARDPRARLKEAGEVLAALADCETQAWERLAAVAGG